MLAGLIAPSIARGAPSVRGYSDGTITLGGYGLRRQLRPDGTIGATARFKRFNDDNEIKGIKIEYTEFADDNQDPAKSLTEARRLVEQVGVFAIVPNLSDTNPGDYLNQRHVPYFGWAFDDTYCSAKPTTALYGYGFNGCLVPADPKRMPGTVADQLYKYVSAKTSKKTPTLALFSTDTQLGQDSTGFQASSYAGAGFKVVYSKGMIPPTSRHRLHPVRAGAHDVRRRQATGHAGVSARDRLHPRVRALKANGYTGTFYSPLYSDLLAGRSKAVGERATTCRSTEEHAAAAADDRGHQRVQGRAAITSGVAASYFSADMFISTLRS